MSDELREIQARRAARREAATAARDKQYVEDMKALDQLEEEHGAGNVTALHVNTFVPGLPTMLVVKSPSGTSYVKRFIDQVRRANGNKQAEGAAQDMLARSCIVYPADDKAQDAMLAAFPTMLNDAASAAIAFVKTHAEEEKKD